MARVVAWDNLLEPRIQDIVEAQGIICVFLLPTITTAYRTVRLGKVGLSVPYCELSGGRSQSDPSIIRHRLSPKSLGPSGLGLFCHLSGGPRPFPHPLRYIVPADCCV